MLNIVMRTASKNKTIATDDHIIFLTSGEYLWSETMSPKNDLSLSKLFSIVGTRSRLCSTNSIFDFVSMIKTASEFVLDSFTRVGLSSFITELFEFKNKLGL